MPVMISDIHQFEVGRQVVSPIAIDVMNHLTRLWHHSVCTPVDKMVLVTVSSPVPHSRVAGWGYDEFVLSIAHVVW